MYNTAENNIRTNYYNVSGVPTLKVDGNVDAGGWENYRIRIGAEMAVASPLDIKLAGEFEPSTRTGHVDITIIGTMPISYSNLKVRVAITESNLYWPAPNETTNHEQTFRDLTPNATGISLTIAQGDTVEITQNFSCPSPLVPANCDVVVFVQSDTGRRILQGAKVNVMSLSYFLDPFSLISPPNNDSLPTCFPTCIWEPTVDQDSGYAISYQVLIGRTPNFDNPSVVSDTIPDTTWACPICLWEDSTYYWKVLAFNGHAPARSSEEVFAFTVDEFAPYFLDPFNLISPANGDTIDNCYPSCVWQHSADPDSGYSVSYQVFLSRSPDFDSPLVSEMLADTSWLSTYCLAETTYYWKVVASNGHAPDRECNQVFLLTYHAPPVCDYVVGDVNNSGIFNGLDVTYSVGYFKGGASPPYPCECTTGHIWFVAGDVNGNCGFNGIDVTYMVGYFKGGPPPIPCPDCPPDRR